MNTTPGAASRRVILAGISEERLDLFLLLNEGAGYEVTGVIDARGAGESSRIAEILGVPVLVSEEAANLPEADLLIYGDDHFRSMGGRLSLDAENVWHESDAWRYLTEGDESTLNEESGASDEAIATASGEWRDGDDARPPEERFEEETDPGTAAPRPEGAGGDPIAAPYAEAMGEAAPPRSGRPGAEDPDAVRLLGEFARASGDLVSLYGWILERAIEMSGAAAGGIAPAESVRPLVWRDRRQTPRGQRPAFLDPGSSVPGSHTLLLGAPDGPGSGRVVLVGGHEGGPDLARFLESVAPALAGVAELDDHRRRRSWDDVVHRLAGDLADGDAPGDSIADACKSLAETLGARECVLMFRSADGEVLRGFSSNGQRIVSPVASGPFGDAGDRPRRLVDERGLWHYHVPFGSGTRSGSLGLFGVEAAPGTVEALGHQAVGLAQALAERFPDAAWNV